MFSYDNVGSKIQGLAQALAVVEAVCAIISGIILIASGGISVLFGALLFVLGPIVAWISSLFLYGFGLLIENSDILVANNLEKKPQKKGQKRITVTAKSQKDTLGENDFIDISCPYCNETLSYTKADMESKAIVNCPLCDAPIRLHE